MAQRPGKGFDGVEMHHMEDTGMSPGSPGALSHHALQQSNAGAGHTAYSQEGTHNEPHSAPHHAPPMHRNMKVFVVFVLLWEIMIIILLAIFATYGETADAKHTDEVTAHIVARHARKMVGAEEELEVAALEANMISTSFYAFLQDVHVMIFIGFGFLMTFLKRYGYSAVGITLLVSAMVIQWHMLVNPFWENIINAEEGHAWTEKIQIDAHLWLVSDFCAGAAMITFGGLIGKISPIQMAVLAALETVLYSLNENIGIKLGVADIGGTTVIHMFGAYFGMASTRVLSDKIRQGGHKMNGATYTSDIFAMIGTVYLWMFWPSFNGAPAVTATQQHRAVLNTLLSLTGSTMAAFMTSTLFRHDHRFNMVDVQNATIAGGVVMGGCADLYVGPAWAVLIGFGAGFLSVTGYCFINPFLENKLGFLDTCGINNLHGMPSILGAILAAIYASAAKYSEYGSDLNAIYFKRGVEGAERSASYQAGMQLLFIAITLGISIVGGIICAFIAKIPIFAGPGNAFDDSDFWETPEEEPPMLSAGNLKTSTGATVEDRLRQLERELRQLQNA